MSINYVLFNSTTEQNVAAAADFKEIGVVTSIGDVGVKSIGRSDAQAEEIDAYRRFVIAVNGLQATLPGELGKLYKKHQVRHRTYILNEGKRYFATIYAHAPEDSWSKFIWPVLYALLTQMLDELAIKKKVSQDRIDAAFRTLRSDVTLAVAVVVPTSAEYMARYQGGGGCETAEMRADREAFLTPRFFSTLAELLHGEGSKCTLDERTKIKLYYGLHHIVLRVVIAEPVPPVGEGAHTLRFLYQEEAYAAVGVHCARLLFEIFSESKQLKEIETGEVKNFSPELRRAVVTAGFHVTQRFHEVVFEQKQTRSYQADAKSVVTVTERSVVKDLAFTVPPDKFELSSPGHFPTCFRHTHIELAYKGGTYGSEPIKLEKPMQVEQFTTHHVARAFVEEFNMNALPKGAEGRNLMLLVLHLSSLLKMQKSAECITVYSPTFCDYRGRLYSEMISSIQATRHSRPLFCQRTPYQLDEAGRTMLFAVCAFAAGFSKVEHPSIRELAACRDRIKLEMLKTAASINTWHEACAPKALSRRSVAIDATASGLQLISIIMGCRKLMEVTNVFGTRGGSEYISTRVNDIYETVVMKMRETYKTKPPHALHLPKQAYPTSKELKAYISKMKRFKEKKDSAGRTNYQEKLLSKIKGRMPGIISQLTAYFMHTSEFHRKWVKGRLVPQAYGEEDHSRARKIYREMERCESSSMWARIHPVVLFAVATELETHYMGAVSQLYPAIIRFFKLAKDLGKAQNSSLAWTTSAGFRVEMAYYITKKIQIRGRTKKGKRTGSFHILQFKHGKDGKRVLDKMAMGRALGPNFTHSADAAIVHEMVPWYSGRGGTLLTIHDSFLVCPNEAQLVNEKYQMLLCDSGFQMHREFVRMLKEAGMHEDIPPEPPRPTHPGACLFL